VTGKFRLIKTASKALILAISAKLLSFVILSPHLASLFLPKSEFDWPKNYQRTKSDNQA
jgi:hypothetical protein